MDETQITYTHKTHYDPNLEGLMTYFNNVTINIVRQTISKCGLP
jgi:hypothetical protein